MAVTPERRSFLASPRNQRYALWTGIVVLVIGAAAFTFAFFRNTGNPAETFSNKPADIFKPQKTVKVDPAARRVAGEFIKTAVARKDLAASYDLVHPELRQGFTRKQWETGNIPVVFYPTGDIQIATFKVDRSYKREVVLQVFMVPRPGSGVKPAIFFIGLKRVGGDDGPWKVFYWVPRYRPAVPDPG